MHTPNAFRMDILFLTHFQYNLITRMSSQACHSRHGDKAASHCEIVGVIGQFNTLTESFEIRKFQKYSILEVSTKIYVSFKAKTPTELYKKFFRPKFFQKNPPASKIRMTSTRD